MKDLFKIQELREKHIKILDDYFNSLNPYDYDNSVWENIKSMYHITKEKVNMIEEDDEKKFEREFYNLFDDFKLKIKKEYTLKSDVLTSREIFLRNVRDIGTKVFGAMTSVWDRIKHLFAIPAITFASFVFSMCLHIVFSFALYWIFPMAYTEAYDGVIEAIMALVIFIWIRYAIIKDVYLNNPKVDIKKYLFKHTYAVFIWWLLAFTIRYKEAYIINDFFFAYRMILLPYMTLGAFTHEFFTSTIIMYFVANFIPLFMAYIYIKISEKGFDELAKLNKKYDEKVEDDSYQFRAKL